MAAAPTGPNLLTSLISTSSGPLMTLSRLLIALFFVWLGLTKIIPGWNPLETEAQLLLSALTQDKVDSKILLYVIGGWQVVAGATLMLIITARVSVVVLWSLIALYGVIFFYQFSALRLDGQPTQLASMMVRNALLTLAAIAIASRGIKDSVK